jgi:hypothetical protein
MRRISKRKKALFVGGLVVVLATCGLGALAAISSGSDPQATPVEQLAATPTGPGRFMRAYGLSSAEATTVFSLGNGQTVSIVGGTLGKCLIRSGVGGSSEGCDTPAVIDEGKAIWVADECATSGENRMEITGLAPEGVSAVRLDKSNGTHEEARVADGAFEFEGTNPASGDPYPTSVEWLDASGASVGEASLPVNGDEFCIPAS